MLRVMRLTLICADYSFETGQALRLPESLRLWLEAFKRGLGTLRENNIEYPEPQGRTGRFWLTLCDAILRRGSDGLSLQVGSLLLPEAVTITEADAARGKTEIAVALGRPFRITQVDRQGGQFRIPKCPARRPLSRARFRAMGIGPRAWASGWMPRARPESSARNSFG
jgi:hypothetical protein